MELIKTLSNYMYDCIKEEFKSSTFRNLNSNKENRVIEADELIFAGDDADIIEIMTKAELNKTLLNLVYGELFLIGDKGKNVYYTPLIYSDCVLRREGAQIVADVSDDKTVNVGAISSLILGDDSEQVENIINQLLDVNVNDFETVLRGLVDLSGLEIVDKRAVILAKIPEASAGLLSELKKIGV